MALWLCPHTLPAQLRLEDPSDQSCLCAREMGWPQVTLPCSWEKRAQTFDFQGTLPVWLWLPSFPWARSCVMRSSARGWNQSVFCCIIVWFFSWREVSSFHSHRFAAWLEPGQQNCVKLHKNRGGCLNAGLQSRLCCVCQPRAEWEQRGVVGRDWQLF